MNRRRWLMLGLVAGAMWVAGNQGMAVGQIVFGLDNRPQSPLGFDPSVPTGGNGAEDPFGQNAGLTSIGPSPSLGVGPYSDASVLMPGVAVPVLHINAPPGTNYIDAMSGNTPPPHGKPVRLAFSVDRLTSGAPGTAVFEQFSLHQQPSDIFSSQIAFPDPLGIPLPVGFGYVGSVSSVPFGGNVLTIDESTLTLTATGTPGELLPPDVLAPPIAPGTHDNVDSLYFKPFDLSGDTEPDLNFYYSVNPDQPGLNPLYQSAADIYFETPDGLVRTFAQSLMLGLDSVGINTDDVDALILYDLNESGKVEPGLDAALFSLGPGSASLEMFHLSAGDVFLTDFQGRFVTYATACSLGLDTNCDPAAAGFGRDGAPSSANLDALGWAGILGDMNIDGAITRGDVTDFVQGLVDPVEYFFTHFGLPPAFAGDMDGDTYHDFDDIGSFADTINAFAPSPANVPEPVGGMAWGCTLGLLLSRRGLRTRGTQLS